MGIKNLFKLMNSKEGIIIKKDNKYYNGKIIAIDISILMYQVVISIRNTGTDLTNKKGEITSHILGIFNKTLALLKKGIVPFYIFDGKPPELKSKTLKNRRKVRKKAIEKLKNIIDDNERIKYFKRSVIISKKQIYQCQELLKLMGIPYINAPEEADSQCAYLSKNGLVYAVLTEDMDILTFGANKIVKNLSSYRNIPLEIDRVNLLQRFGLNNKQFVELCVLLGCDYCNHIKSISTDKIFEYYSRYKDIKLTLENMSNDGVNVNSLKNYNDAINYFENPNITEIKKEDIILLEPKYDELLDLLVNKYNLIKYKIIKKLDRLVNNYDKYKKNVNVVNI